MASGLSPPVGKCRYLQAVRSLSQALRPIVSLPGTPTYRLAKELHQRLKHLVEDSHHSIRSTQEFPNTINNTKIVEDEIMVSFDVTALFTSININLAKETLTTLLEEPKTHTPDTTSLISKDNIIKLVDLCLTTHFTFTNKTYRQTNGTPTGSPISGFLAEAVMQRLEQTALPTIQPKLWVRYVDDTFVINKQNKLEETFKTINNTLYWHNIHKRGGKQQQSAIPRCHSRANSQWGTSNQRLQENNTYGPNTELQEQPSQHPQTKLH
ncbi:uncharacterized protein LOC132209322 [Stegostoma tigrinum]|nr:uncharacterized protein LOC132208830 isoform X3 [Stegostoma tigrinum]XP_059500314.1 uncharacterized protein LOC132209187 [Stegostoma tigrinum]XP_059500435.1 uncharacterized protein LOC132209322 [Stegostoma tigrinum]